MCHWPAERGAESWAGCECRYWKFTAGKRWDQQRKKPAHSPAAETARPRPTGAPKEALQAQLAGLRRKAAFRARSRPVTQQPGADIGCFVSLSMIKPQATLPVIQRSSEDAVALHVLTVLILSLEDMCLCRSTDVVHSWLSLHVLCNCFSKLSCVVMALQERMLPDSKQRQVMLQRRRG